MHPVHESTHFSEDFPPSWASEATSEGTIKKSPAFSDGAFKQKVKTITERPVRPAAGGCASLRDALRSSALQSSSGRHSAASTLPRRLPHPSSASRHGWDAASA